MLCGVDHFENGKMALWKMRERLLGMENLITKL